MRITFSVDLDSTLNNLDTVWLGYVNKKNSTNYTIKDITSYSHSILSDNFEFITQSDMYDYLDILPGAIEFIESLKEIGNVQIVTHTFKEHKLSKLKFIKKHFNDIEVICTDSNKTDIVDGTFLIDDNKQHIIDHINNFNYGMGVIFSNKDTLQYNKIQEELLHNYPRLGTYNEILDYIIVNMNSIYYNS